MMADEADISDERATMQLAAYLSIRKPKGPQQDTENPRCLDPGCCEPLTHERRWCGPECRDAWERAKK